MAAGHGYPRFILLLIGFIATISLYTEVSVFKSHNLLNVTTLQFSLGSTTAENSTVPLSVTPQHNDDPDANCIFRNSKLYRKVYVYPSPNEAEWHADNASIITSAGRAFHNASWPWLEFDAIARENEAAHYNINRTHQQFSTELLVRELFVNPQSCLRTNDPETADLFYVPYLPSTENSKGQDNMESNRRSPWGMAIREILEKNNYESWEQRFGLTSKYWKRREGSDHVLVFSEPMHGLWHPPRKRGHYHFIHTQKQLTPPIVFSIELSTPFVQQYPNCARKNILLPYPNPHGAWFNGQFGQYNRTISQYFSAGMHGSCEKLRKAMKADYDSCSPSFHQLAEQDAKDNTVGMRKSIFCPCPGGDSPSAKRMFDSLIAGCIPVILSKEFIWPFTNEFDPSIDLDPSAFSLRLPASEYESPLLDPNTCQPLDPQKPGLQAVLDRIPAEGVRKLQEGAVKAGKLFSWYKENPELPLNLLKERILPDGGTAHYVVRMLEDRAAGKLWPACRDELATMPAERDEPGAFHC